MSLAFESLSETTTARVADRIRYDILYGRIEPGSRLKILELAARYRISHMPIREALRDLEGEGLVDLSPHRGATVRLVDEEFIVNIYDVRIALESLVAARAAERVDTAGVAQLEELVARHEAAVAKTDVDVILRRDRELHDTIGMISGNPEANRALARGRVLVEALRLQYGYGRNRLTAIIAEHRAIVASIVKGDASRAAERVKSHVAGARDALLLQLRQKIRAARTSP